MIINTNNQYLTTKTNKFISFSWPHENDHQYW